MNDEIRTNLTIDRETQSTTSYSFEFADKRGRTIGVDFYLCEATFSLQTESDIEERRCYYRHAPGHYFSATAHATRDGIRYGACQSAHYFDTEEERAEWIEAYVGRSRKRAAKIAAAAAA